MKDAMQIFKNEEFGQITAIEKDGKPWFVGKEIAKALGYKRTADAIREHCKGVGEMTLPSKGGMQLTKIIPESDLYRLIMRSKLPNVEKFQDWVVEVVLPSIRETGSYSKKQLPGNFIDALKALVASEEEKQELSLELEKAQPAIEFTEVVTKSAESIRVGDYAKMLSDSVGITIGPNKLMEYFRDKGYLMKGRDAVEKNKPYQTAIDAGLFEFKVERPQPHIVVNVTYITGKGQFELKDEILRHF